MNILIIDDEIEIVHLLQRMLSKKYTVFTANDGETGLSLFKENEIDLVITDIIMPNTEGIEVIFNMIKEKPNCKIIAMSGGGFLSSAEYLETAEAIGAIKTFAKPFETKQMVQAVDELLESK